MLRQLELQDDILPEVLDRNLKTEDLTPPHHARRFLAISLIKHGPQIDALLSYANLHRADPEEFARISNERKAQIRATSEAEAILSKPQSEVLIDGKIGTASPISIWEGGFIWSHNIGDIKEIGLDNMLTALEMCIRGWFFVLDDLPLMRTPYRGRFECILIGGGTTSKTTRSSEDIAMGLSRSARYRYMECFINRDRLRSPLHFDGTNQDARFGYVPLLRRIGSPGFEILELFPFSPSMSKQVNPEVDLFDRVKALQLAEEADAIEVALASPN